MGKKRELITIEEESVMDAFNRFLTEKLAAGLRIKTSETYKAHMNAIGRFADLSVKISDLNDRWINKAIGDMAKTDLSRNTIRSYTATLQSFIGWCNDNGLCMAKVRLFKGEETIPETYSQEELKKLLKAPNLKSCGFGEYRCWVIANILINNGPRAATIRNIKVKDVFLDDSVIFLRHMKAKRTISMPLCPELVGILRRYMAVRKGSPDDYLFCEVDGTQMSENCLRVSMERYHHSRGVKKTGLHKYRHTFARLYLIECDGDALKLQKLLGHSTLDMTKHYVKMFDKDLIKEFETRSPLSVLKSDKIRLTK